MYTSEQWSNRNRSRSDITAMLTHLTKPSQNSDINNLSFDDINIKAVDTLIKILKDKKINGSTTTSGFIIGSRPAVCFQDAPMIGLMQNILHEEERNKNTSSRKVRYCGVGLAFRKPFIFRSNGRPVLYESTAIAKSLLSPNEHWRIVNFELNNPQKYIDWTHEREWRVPDNFLFDYGQVHVILYNSRCYTYFIKNCPQNIIDSVGGITTLAMVTV